MACADSNQMKALLNHFYPILKAQIEKQLERLDCKINSFDYHNYS